MELSREEIDRFIENNLLNFSINGSGWRNLIRNMLEEFCLAGWDLNEKVGGKEKFGGLRCYSFSEDEKLNIEIQKIIRKYGTLSVQTCEECGNKGKLRFVKGWDTTLCIDHYINEISVINIEADNILINDTFLFKMNQIKKVEMLNSFREMRVYLTRNEKYITLDARTPNYYLLLKSLPLAVLSVEIQNSVRLMFENLNNCEICGHLSLWKDRCLRCNEEPWQNSFLEDYENKTEYIKQCQMLLFIDQDGYEEVFTFCDKSFEKPENHRILFNIDEFEEFKKYW